MEKIEIRELSHSGKGKTNEDCMICKRLHENCVVAILADGMGGLSHGAEAAAIVSRSILTELDENIRQEAPENALRNAFDTANAAIYANYKELKCRMGAAVTVALIINNTLYYAWQGNVRLYLSRGGELSLLTTDHAVTYDENTFLTRCVNGKDFRTRVPVEKFALKQGDNVYLCSDGFYAGLSENELFTASHNLSIYEPDDDASLIELRAV